MFVICLKLLKVIIAPASRLPNTGQVPGIPLKVLLRNLILVDLFLLSARSLISMCLIDMYNSGRSLCHYHEISVRATATKIGGSGSSQSLNHLMRN